MLQPHRLYTSLGADVASRRAAYRELFRDELEPGLVDQIRRTANGNVVLGDGRFSEQIATALGRRVTHKPAGRPKTRGAEGLAGA